MFSRDVTSPIITLVWFSFTPPSLVIVQLIAELSKLGVPLDYVLFSFDEYPGFLLDWMLF